MTTNNLVNLETAVQGFLAVGAPTPESIRKLIAQFRVIESCAVTDLEAEQLARKFESQHGVTMTIGAVLTEKGYEPWLETARPKITPYYWDRYRKLLAQKRYSGQVLAAMDSVTDRILGLLENPDKDGPWDRRGMVVGHVQSGKTANYVGLLCKAADAGYKIIIVIAGIHNNLRNQTQMRIDEGFVGRDSSKRASRKDNHIGVGLFDRTHEPWTFTTATRDFNKIGANTVGGKLSDLSVPAVFVIKKNSKTLTNLLEWLSDHNAKGKTIAAPMLVIDDEADNASINIKHDNDEISNINGQIRDLLKMFDRSCYIGYTATPFANIFIDPDTAHAMRGADLFPKSFIVSLDAPSNYFGPRKVFIEDVDIIVQTISDNEDCLPLKHTKEFQIAGLPDSLMEAIRSFVVARAIRLFRGQVNQHASMLVNVSRFTDVQRQLRNEIHQRLERIQASCRVYGALKTSDALRNVEMQELHSVWQKHYQDACNDWPAVQALLHEAASPIKAVEVNSRSTGALNYADHEKTGLAVIAVGGFSLSRGLTLEGLTVSYFLRNSMMYDTLMQMGRWFGYRPDYEDLCRIWMPDEATGWYQHVTDSVEELREEMRVMEAANATPEEFGLKVRSHPDTLIVTARNKMGSSEPFVVSIGLANHFIETTILKDDERSLEKNREAAQHLAEGLAAIGKPLAASEVVSSGWLVRDVPVDDVIRFLTEFQAHSAALLTSPGPVRNYIDKRRDGELANWDILFPSSSRHDHVPLLDTSLGVEIFCQRRKKGESKDGALLVTNNARVASRGVEKTAVDPADAAAAEEAFKKNSGKKDGVTNFPDAIYRRVRRKPLLIVHLLSIGEKGDDLSAQKPTVAWSISFPKTDMEEERVEYIVNTTWLRENYREDRDEEEMRGDDE